MINRVRDVFAEVPYPGDDNLLGAPEHVQSCGECSGLHKALVGRTWRDLAENDSSSGYVSHAMSFFSPEAWHYYLPAYLIQNLKRGVFSCLYFRPIGAREYLEDRIKYLTREQCRVVIAFLLLAVGQDPSGQQQVDRNAEAVEYWKKMCQKLSE